MKTFNRILESIEQLIAWFPIIWNTHDFDHDYLLEIIQFKMKRMYKFLTSKYAVALHEECDLLALKRCIAILDLLQEEKYQDPLLDEHYAKFPINKIDDWFLPRVGDENFRVMKPMGKEERKDFGKMIKREEKDHKKLITEFNDLFAKHYRDWWD